MDFLAGREMRSDFLSDLPQLGYWLPPSLLHCILLVPVSYLRFDFQVEHARQVSPLRTFYRSP